MTLPRLVAAACAALALAGCGHGGATSRSGLTDVHGVAPLRAQFNADDGHPRLLVLLSPT